MYSISNIECILASSIESIFPSFSDPKLGLQLIMQFHYEDMGFHENGNDIVREPWQKTFYLEMIFKRSSNRTLVLTRFIHEDDHFDSIKYRLGKPLVFEQMSHHDSCWRSDGFSQWFGTFMDANDEYGEARGGDLRDHLSARIGFDLTSGLQFVEFESIDRDQTADNPYLANYIVIVKRTLTVKQAAEFMSEDK